MAQAKTRKNRAEIYDYEAILSALGTKQIITEIQALMQETNPRKVHRYDAVHEAVSHYLKVLQRRKAGGAE